MNVCNFSVLLDHFQTIPSVVFDLLSTMNCHKACGPNMICPHLLKEEASEISCSLLIHLTNLYRIWCFL